MEMAELEHPSAPFRDQLHSSEIISDKTADPSLCSRRNTSDDFVPAESAFLARHQHGIEKSGRTFRTGLQRGQIENPRHSSELKTKTVYQQDEPSFGRITGGWSCNKSTQGLAEAIAECGQC